MVDRSARLFGALTVACALGAGLLISTPAAADATPGYDCVVDTPNSGSSIQPLRVCASFDKAAYGSGDAVKLTVTVTNLGSATAPGVTIWESTMSGTFHPTGNPVGPLITNGSIGGSLPAGASITSELDGYAADPASGTVTFAAPVYQFVNGTGNATGDQVSITSQVTQATGDYSGVVFTDANGNGAVDPGEGLAGSTVTLTGPFDGINGNPAQTFSATSDANGEISLTGLPAGSYRLSATSPSGWDVQPSTFTPVVSPTATAPEQFHAWPASVPLKAAMTFDQSSYHAGDTVNATVTLTNTGTIPLNHVTAECDPAAEDGVMLSRGAGWDQFTGDGSPGLAVAAGQTITLHLSEILPVEEYGNQSGTYYGDCAFAPSPGFDLANSAEASTSATVLAPTVPTTDFVVDFVNDAPGGALDLGGSVVGLNLLDPTSQDVVAGGYFGDSSGSTVTVAKGGVDDISLGKSSQTWQLAPGQATTLDTADLTAGQTVTIHVVPIAQPAPASPPSTSGLRGNPKPVSPTCGTQVCLY